VILNKGAKTYAGEKTPMNGVGKTEYPHVND
jgi:hypothetical protein